MKLRRRHEDTFAFSADRSRISGKSRSVIKSVGLAAAGASALLLAGCASSAGVSDSAVKASPSPSQVIFAGKSWTLTLCDPGAPTGQCPTTDSAAYSGSYTIPLSESLPPFKATSNPAQFDMTETDLGCYSFLDGYVGIDPVIGVGLDWPYLGGDTEASQDISLDVTGTIELWGLYPPTDCTPETSSGLSQQQKKQLQQKIKQQAKAANLPATPKPSKTELGDVPSENACKASSYCGEIQLMFPVANAAGNGPSPVDSTFTSQVATINKTGNSFIDSMLSLPRQAQVSSESTLTAS